VLTLLLFGSGPPALANPLDFMLWQELTGVAVGDGQWGDFDADGDLDLVISGETSAEVLVTRTYENQGGTLVARQDLVGVYNGGSGNLAWGDYDADGDLDLAVAGYTGERTSDRTARVYENDGNGNLTWDAEQALTGVNAASVAWGDYNNDGDLDLVVAGHDGTQYSTILYKNDHSGSLAPDETVSLTGVYNGSADWADYDSDGDLDLLLTGSRGAHQPRIFFYENGPLGTFTDVGGHGIPPIARSDAAWGDYDADGDLDLAISGDADGWVYGRIYRNDGAANFVQIADLLDFAYSSCAWGDYDNDGDLDVAFIGCTWAGYYGRIYENTGTGFTQAFVLPAICGGSLTWGDVDQDGDLDLFLTGRGQDSSLYARLYENVGAVPNTAPSAPTELSAEWTGDGLHLIWTGASDAETPTAGLYYCLRVGTSPGAHDVMSGTYGTPLMGNVYQATEIVLNVPSGTYYWSVRTIDSGFMASSWSEEIESTVLGVLLVGSKESDSVLAYQGSTGGFIREIAAADSGLDYPNGIVFDGADNFYVASAWTDTVLKYSLWTGEPLLQFSGGGLDGPDGLLLQEATLLVSSYSTDSVKEYNLETGFWLRDFVTSGSGGLDGSGGVTRAANGNLLVASQRGDQVLEYDGETGAFVGVAAEGGGLNGPEALLLDAEGNLLVASFYTSSVLKYAADGTFLGEFVASGSGGLSGAYGLAWGANGNLLVSSRDTDSVLEYDGGDGSFVGEFAAGGGLEGATHIALLQVSDPDCNYNDIMDQWDIDMGTSRDINGDGVPDECDCPGDITGDGTTDQRDLGILLALWGICDDDPNYDPRADLDGDGCIGQGDLGILLADWGCTE